MGRFDSEQTDIEKIKRYLIDTERFRLEALYPNSDAWRRPENIAESMMCVGYAMSMLDNYKRQIDQMSDQEVINLYKGRTY